MPHNSMDLYEPGKCSQCGNAIRNHGAPWGFCGDECQEEYDAAEAYHADCECGRETEDGAEYCTECLEEIEQQRRGPT